jgi:hypothetical protein
MEVSEYALAVKWVAGAAQRALAGFDVGRGFWGGARAGV